MPPRWAKLVAAKPSIADLTFKGRVVTAKNPAVALDFGGYLKGVALDRAAAIFKARGIGNALINIGGNVLALGKKGDQPWRVGIRHPRPEQAGGAPLATLELRDGEAIGTSGDYQRFFELDGRRYCHLIDPRSGAPATGTQALTVLIPAGHEMPACCRTCCRSRCSSPAPTGRHWRRNSAPPRCCASMRQVKSAPPPPCRHASRFEPADLPVSVVP